MSNQQNVTTVVEYKSFALPAPMDASFDAADVAEDLEGLELSFPRVKIPGGGVPQFKMPGEDPDHPTYVGEIEGIILYNHSANACWPEGSEYDDNTPPQCQSMDGKQGYGDPGLLCEACGNNQFGSSGKGKLCKNMRMLYILQDGAYMPLQLALPPTSIKPYKNFVNMAFALRNRPVYGSLVKITLKPVSTNGFDYSVAVFNRVRDFAGEELAAVKTYAEGFRKMVKEMLEQRAQAHMEAAANIVQTVDDPLELPDNDGHFAVGILDGERELMPA